MAMKTAPPISEGAGRDANDGLTDAALIAPAKGHALLGGGAQIDDGTPFLDRLAGQGNGGQISLLALDATDLQILESLPSFNRCHGRYPRGDGR